MTSENEYEREDEGEIKYETRLLKDLRASVRAIDGKVEEILDELKEHFQSQRRHDNDWGLRDLYNDDDSYDFG